MVKPLTKAAVFLAVAEHKQLGREKFLKKYGAGRALEYFLKIGGQEYDSKAIVRAALIIHNAEEKPRMTGGKDGAATLLETLGFKVEYRPRGKGKDVNWTWDEHVLALQLYLQTRPKLAGPSSKGVRELSRLLNLLAELNGVVRTEKYRNPDGVNMKLGNFQSRDPEYTGQSRILSDGTEVKKVGLQRGAGGEEEVWARYHADKVALDLAADTIRAYIVFGVPVLDEIEPYEHVGAREGKVVMRTHKSRERKPSLVKAKLDQVQKLGPLECEVCEFTFGDIYGKLGAGFLEVHHNNPIYLSEPDRVTTLEELAVVCPNCHRMLHRNGLLTIEELRAIIREHAGAPADRQPRPALSR